jgi:hypothetical protein
LAKRALFGMAAGLLGLLGAGRARAERGVAEIEAVQVAVLQKQVTFWLDDHARASKMVVCLSIDDGGTRRSLPKEYLSKLPDDEAVRVSDQCEERAAGAVERTTLRPAVLVSVGEMSWRSENEVWVTTRHYRSGLISGLRTQRVVREPLGWVCLGQIIKDGPV